MKLKQLGSNQTELDMGDVQVFFSYETPVSTLTDGGTATHTSMVRATTSKHINKWLGEGCYTVAVHRQ